MAVTAAAAAHGAAFQCRAQRRAARHAPRLPPPPPRGCEAACRRLRRAGISHCASGDSASERAKEARGSAHAYAHCTAAADTSAAQASASQLQALEAALAAAIAREDYTEAARVRDKLRFARADALQGVEAASAAFYAAFERMNARDMARAWGFGDHVSCTHPGAATIVGREQARCSERCALFASGGRLTCPRDPRRCWPAGTPCFRGAASSRSGCRTL